MRAVSLRGLHLPLVQASQVLGGDDGDRMEQQDADMHATIVI